MSTEAIGSRPPPAPSLERISKIWVALPNGLSCASSTEMQELNESCCFCLEQYMRMAKLDNSEEFFHLLWESLHSGLPTPVSSSAPADEKDRYADILCTAQMKKMQQMFSLQVTICKLMWYSGINHVMVQRVLQGQLQSFMHDAFNEKKIATKTSAAATAFPRFFNSAKAFTNLTAAQRDLLYMSTMYFLTKLFSIMDAHAEMSLRPAVRLGLLFSAICRNDEKQIEYGQVSIELLIQARALSTSTTMQSVIQSIVTNSQLVHGTMYPEKQQYLAFLDILLAAHQNETVPDEIIVAEDGIYEASIGTEDDTDSSSSSSVITVLNAATRGDSLRRLNKLPEAHAIAKLSKNLGFTSNVLNDAILTLSVSDESTSSSSAKGQLPRLAPVFPKKDVQPSADLENLLIGQTTEQLVQQFEEDSPSAMAGKTPLEFLSNLSDQKAVVFGSTTDDDGVSCDAKVIQVDVQKLQMAVNNTELDTTIAPSTSQSPVIPGRTADSAVEKYTGNNSEDVNKPDAKGKPDPVGRPIGNIARNSSSKKPPCLNRSFTFGGPGWVSSNVGQKFASEDVRLRDQELLKAKNAQAQKKAIAQAKAIEREKAYDKSEAFDSHRDCQVGFGSISGERGPLPPPATLPSIIRTNRAPVVQEIEIPAPTAPASAPPTIEEQLMNADDVTPIPYMLTFVTPGLDVDGICSIEPDFATKWDPTVGVFHQTKLYYEDCMARLRRGGDCRSMRDVDGKLLNVPYRMEFLCAENQRRMNSRNLSLMPQTMDSDRDYLFEDRRMSQEEGKAIARVRKDCFFSVNYFTRGCLFVLELLHQRSFVGNVCKSSNPVTRVRHPGLVCQSTMCKIKSCREHGPCHLNGCCLPAHFCNKWEMMRLLSNKLLLIAKTKTVTSYENVGKDVLDLMERYGLDPETTRIVRYDGDPAAARYDMPIEKDILCTTARANLPGPYYRVKPGQGNISDRNLVGHSYSKYILEVTLAMFGFDFFVCVSTGEILINCEALSIEQCIAFLIFCKIYASFNGRQRDAGVTPEQITIDHGNFCYNSMMQWPYGRRPSERDMRPVTFDVAREVNATVEDRCNRLLRQNRDDPRQNLNHQGQLFYNLKSKSDNPQLRQARSLIEKFDAIHAVHPEFVSMDRPSATAFSDNVICGYSRCTTENCINNVQKLPILSSMFQRYTETDACQDANKRSWCNSSWRDRNKNIRSSLVRFLQDEGLKISTIKRICKIYGTPMLFHVDQIREPNNQLDECYGFPCFNMYAGLYYDFPQCLTGKKYTVNQ